VVKVKFGDADDIIDICQDNVFKAVFTKESPESEKALSELLSCLIGRRLSVVTIVANEPPIDNVRDRQIRFDINCKGEDGELINVEMTLCPDDFEPVRLEFYAGKLFIGQDIRGKDKTFDDLKPAYQISFLVGRAFYDDAEIVHCFEYYDQEHRMSLGGRSRIITVELSKLGKTVEKPVSQMTVQERWSVFFRYITDTTKRQTINQILECEEGIAMASRVLQTISKDEVERARLMSEYKYEVDHQSKMVQARRVGEAVGEAKGRMAERQEWINSLRSGKSVEDVLRSFDKA
jgi:predicted transposase/invertase (TIGR01784 family)